jgi:hypothetical protein
MLNVAIAVDSSTDYGPQAVHVIVAACEEVIGEQRCPAASELGPGMVTAWYAIVHPNDPALGSVRIEFRDRTADGTLIDERSLTFPRGTSQQSRLTSIGSVIAALAAAREGGPIPRRPRITLPEPAPPPVPPEERPPESPSLDWSVGLAGFAVPSLAAGPYRLGALGGAHVGLGSQPFALISGRYALHPGNPKFSWFALSAGIGMLLAERTARFNVELTGEFVIERTSATVRRGTDEENASQNGWGGRAGANAVWMSWPHVSLVAGVDATWILPRVRVVVEGQDVAYVPLTALAFSAGLRWQP